LTELCFVQTLHTCHASMKHTQTAIQGDALKRNVTNSYEHRTRNRKWNLKETVGNSASQPRSSSGGHAGDKHPAALHRLEIAHAKSWIHSHVTHNHKQDTHTQTHISSSSSSFHIIIAHHHSASGLRCSYMHYSTA
jgi:hypothetical protein